MRVTLFAGTRKWIGRFRGASNPRVDETARPAAVAAASSPDLDIAPTDPLLSYLISVATAVDVESLELDSPALDELRSAGATMLVPLVSQGDLVGLLSLGPRLSEQEYSSDDRRLLNNLAAQAAPAVRVAQLVREQQIEVRERERMAQELRVAQLIQQQFLPRQLPDLVGWELAAHYQPAREVGGDFYDFIELPSGELGIVTGDVTDKGVPAALVMASTRSLLRTEALRTNSPGRALERVNDLLVPDIPERMFVTCLYAVLDPKTGHLRYANAGHNLPCLRSGGNVRELRATGMPLGLLPGMAYDEHETDLIESDELLLFSDGLVEAHDAEDAMFGFPRVLEHLASEALDSNTIVTLLEALNAFTGPNHEQEDDITLVTIARISEGAAAQPKQDSDSGFRKTLATFEIPSEPGNERLAIERVLQLVGGSVLEPAAAERLGTAVAEATMNAIEHGNQGRAELPVKIEVARDTEALVVRVTDRGHSSIPMATAPDLDLKLAGLQPARGWGLFLIRNMVDAVREENSDEGHTIELTFNLSGGTSDGIDHLHRDA